ncbi:MAG: FKBP-type peptidyl-prolyl cis-trans isomerase [Bacteroidales bacterium]|nr:FKBP-type peptidyl-prolyl cis-trans isomerase [Bacteroidales bacterium]
MTQAKVISLTYELRTGNAQGDIIETADKANPAQFLFGTGNLIPDFENNVGSLNQGDAFEFIILSENAYGPVNQEALIDLPKSVFVIDGELASDMLEVGNMVPMRDQEGNPLNGKVVEVGEETVKMDFNHPLAGMDLHFKGEVLETREATAEEVSHGHVHTGQDGH